MDELCQTIQQLSNTESKLQNAYDRIVKLEAELATMKAKAEALDRLEALLEECGNLQLMAEGGGVVVRRFFSRNLPAKYSSGPSLSEAINALPRGVVGEELKSLFIGHTPGIVTARCTICGEKFTFHSEYPKFDIQKTHQCDRCIGQVIKDAVDAAGLTAPQDTKPVAPEKVS